MYAAKPVLTQPLSAAPGLGPADIGRTQNMPYGVGARAPPHAEMMIRAHISIQAVPYSLVLFRP